MYIVYGIYLSYLYLLINFTEKPTVCVKLSSQSQKVVYGNAITLQADIKSYPAPSCIRWTRIKNGNNEENIDDIEKFTIDKLEKKCQRLTIKNLEFSDNGNYIIIVTNVLGSTKANLEIKVEGNHFLLSILQNILKLITCKKDIFKRAG